MNPLTRLRRRLALKSGTDVDGTIRRVSAGATLRRARLGVPTLGLPER
ncbi:MAG TPA: hypothetical protein VD793_03950 [Gemmatimonadales bacterium]|nr:hypothetical protein [Gemmatimonadales bacterium]